MSSKQLSNIKKPEITFETLQKVIIEKRGNITSVAKHFKVTRKTIYSHIHNQPELIEAMDEGREVSLDDAEKALDDQIKAGNIAAIIFKLKTLAKQRGYIERQENVNINIDLSKLTNEQLFRLANGEDLQAVLATSSESVTRITPEATTQTIDHSDS